MTTEATGPGAISLPERRYSYLHVKRIVDVVLSVLLLVLLSILMLLLALAIKLHSPGPVIFRQTRIGKNGKPFTFFKYRSMRVNADTSIHQMHVAELIRNHDVAPAEGASVKMDGDPRITGLGRLLRKTSLDELPQLFNVLRGDMSLVGPRPPLPYEVELYEEWHRRRLDIQPGITGLWQVMGRNRVSFDEMVRMDIHYMENLSPWMDLRILAMTPLAALRGDGAG